jgi:hypothetical protein
LSEKQVFELRIIHKRTRCLYEKLGGADGLPGGLGLGSADGHGHLSKINPVSENAGPVKNNNI